MSGFRSYLPKTILLCVLMVIALGVPSRAFAQHTGFGMGFLLGEPAGINAKLWRSTHTALVGSMAWSEGDAGSAVAALEEGLGLFQRVEDVRGEAIQLMENIKTTLEAHGYSMANLIKCTVFLNDMKEWKEFNDVYTTYFEPGRYPARSAFGCTALAFGARFEVECIAVV